MSNEDITADYPIHTITAATRDQKCTVPRPVFKIRKFRIHSYMPRGKVFGTTLLIIRRHVKLSYIHFKMENGHEMFSTQKRNDCPSCDSGLTRRSVPRCPDPYKNKTRSSVKWHPIYVPTNQPTKCRSKCKNATYKMLDTVFFFSTKEKHSPMDPVIITFIFFGITSSRLAFWLITHLAPSIGIPSIFQPPNFVSSFVVWGKKRNFRDSSENANNTQRKGRKK